ncbi:MAG: carboxypeptidase regulatory-like domain-containing protein [bacterium]
MKQHVLVPSIVIVVCGLGFLLITQMDRPNAKATNTSVRVEEGKVEVTSLRDPNRSEVVSANEKITASNGMLGVKQTTQKLEPEVVVVSPTPLRTLESAVSSVAAEPLRGALQVDLTDALGDPIKGGRVEIAGKTYQVPSGGILVSDLPHGQHDLTAHADGYLSTSKIIDIPAVEHVNIKLEYLCSFEADVCHRGTFKPCEGAEVIVWEGASAQRPVPSNTTLVLARHSRPEDAFRIRFTLAEDLIRVDRFDFPRNSWSGSDKLALQPGDVLAGFEGCTYRSGIQPQSSRFFMPLENPVSPRLRVWDAVIAYAAHGPVDPDRRGGCFAFERNDSTFSTEMGELRDLKKAKMVATGVTDSTGKCRFTGLPAGTYCVQARKGDLRSWIRPILPVCGGTKLFMSDTAYVTVSIRQAGIARNTFIKGADVVLKPIEGEKEKGLFVGTIDGVSIFRANFKEVPWGNYTLTVNPPPDSSLAAKTMQITIEEPLNWIEVELSGVGCTVSGRVLEEGTNTPVKDFELELFRRAKEDSGLHGRSTSDADGRFIFTDVQPNGEYTLKASSVRRADAEYVSSPSKGGTLTFDENGNLSLAQLAKPRLLQNAFPNFSGAAELKFDMADHDLSGIEFFVVPAVQTRFTGIVTTQEETPVANAQIKLGYEFCPTNEFRPRTNKDGEFDLSINTPYSEEQQTVNIQAVVLEPVEGRIGPTFGPAQIGFPRCEGYVGVPFHTGDTISGIQIVAKTIPTKHSIVGRVTTEDGELPHDLAIRARARNYYIPGEISDDGSYKIGRVPVGPVWVQVCSEFSSEEIAPYGRVIIKDHCDESVMLQIPEDETELTVDFSLVKAVNFGGVVIDENGKPVPDMEVRCNGENSFGAASTDAEGRFWLWGLRPRTEHTLKVGPDHETTLFEMKNVVPTGQTMILRLEGTAK